MWSRWFSKVTFKDGALLLRIGERTEVFTAQPFSAVARSGDGEPFAPFVPERFGLNPLYELVHSRQLVLDIFPDLEATDRPSAVGARFDAFKAFIAAIPALHRETITRTFRDRHFELLRLGSNVGGGFELMCGNPALAYLIAATGYGNLGWEGTSARVDPRVLVAMRQRDALAAFGFPRSEACARVFRKLDRALFNPECLISLRRVLADETAVAVLSHVRKVTISILRVMTNPKLTGRLLPRLILELALLRDADADKALCTLDGIVNMMDVLGADSQSLRLRSLAEMHSRHEHLVERIHAMDLEKMRQAVFRRPPIPGNEMIQPITTAFELFAEGKEMHHCAASYVRSVLERDDYFYRVVSPGRATLRLTRRDNGKRELTWMVGELRGWANGEPSLAVHGAVQQWLRVYNARREARAAARRGPAPEWRKPDAGTAAGVPENGTPRGARAC